MYDFLVLIIGTFVLGCVLGVGYKAGMALGEAATRPEKYDGADLDVVMEHTHGGDPDDPT